MIHLEVGGRGSGGGTFKDEKYGEYGGIRLQSLSVEKLAMAGTLQLRPV